MEDINENVVNEATEVTTKSTKRTTKKTTAKRFERDTLIPCRSVTYGELLLPGKKSQLLYTWADCNDVTDVEYQDLQALRSVKSQYLYNPCFLIEDEELLEQWSDLKELYDRVAKADIHSLFDLPIKKFELALRDIPVGYKDAVKNAASAKILDGSLDSIQKIRLLDEILGTDLKFYIQ